MAKTESYKSLQVIQNTKGVIIPNGDSNLRFQGQTPLNMQGPKQNDEFYQANIATDMEQSVMSDNIAKAHAMEKMGRLSTAHSQVDGVAQRWNRIDGEVPTGSQRDQDQVLDHSVI